MLLATLIWGAPDWVLPASLVTAAALVLVIQSYFRSHAGLSTSLTAGVLKVLGFCALALCLIEPLFHGERPRPGANLYVVLADNSQSLQIHSKLSRGPSRGEEARKDLTRAEGWQSRLGQDFDLRRYVFDSQLRSVSDFDQLTLDGQETRLQMALTTLRERFQDRPLAGALLFSDGIATDLTSWGREELASLLQGFPPIYAVIPGRQGSQRDLSVKSVTVSQSNFEQAPVEIRAEFGAEGLPERGQILVQLLDEAGIVQQQEVVVLDASGKSLAHRFQVQPPPGPVHFYQVRAILDAEKEAWNDPTISREATLVNNQRLVAVNRKQGPYRVLYVSGRPNWEYKFLRRAVEEDAEVELAGLIRIAKKEPKFVFQDRSGRPTNPLFRGAEDAKDEETERYDQPVILRLGIRAETELRDGFPKVAEALYPFDAVVLDDVEAGFFTPDQMTLIHNFVTRRGGGLLMLGGPESFANGGYHRTPIGELLPVYVEKSPQAEKEKNYRLSLTRDGWLQPWVRLRATEEEERQRLAEMPSFQTVNQVGRVKPGAMVLAHVLDEQGNKLPALASQRFGRGRVGALLVGDMWRWSLRRGSDKPDELAKAWRQMIRWMVADVPRRVEMELEGKPGQAERTVVLKVTVRDENYLPMDNVKVSVLVKSPTEEEVELSAEASLEEPGVYQAAMAPRAAGAYRARAVVTAADRSPVGEQEIGWTAQPAVEEFRSVEVNRPLLEAIAKGTGGRVIDADQLDWFVADLPNHRAPISEPWTYPLWHHWIVLAFALVCFVGEWGIRRWRGLA